jgi:hypothetical protein
MAISLPPVLLDVFNNTTHDGAGEFGVRRFEVGACAASQIDVGEKDSHIRSWDIGAAARAAAYKLIRRIRTVYYILYYIFYIITRRNRDAPSQRHASPDSSSKQQAASASSYIYSRFLHSINKFTIRNT